MRPSEIITIYLAAAAPVGVAYFLRHQTREVRDMRLTARATLVALAWPLSLVAGLLERRAHEASISARIEADESGVFGDDAALRVEASKRALIDALRRVEELSVEACGARGENVRRVMYAARESTERYAGLSLAAREVVAQDDDVDDDATAMLLSRETELCRLAGRTGEDLLLAARCIRRRNVARLRAHHERARTELLHALASMRETYGALRVVVEGDSTTLACRVSASLLDAFNRAIELCASLDDPRTASVVARLLDAERARLRRLENPRAGDARRPFLEGESPCPPETPATQPTSTAPLTSTLSRPPNIKQLPQPTT